MRQENLEKMLEQMLDHIVSISWFSLLAKGAVFLVEEKPDVLIMKSSHNLPEEQQRICAQVPFGRCLCGRAALTKKIQFADSIDDRHENCSPNVPPHGHYCVPILSSDNLLGVIILYLEEGHRQNQDEQNFLLTIANIMAGIIEGKY